LSGGQPGVPSKTLKNNNKTTRPNTKLSIRNSPFLQTCTQTKRERMENYSRPQSKQISTLGIFFPFFFF
jgi:hypothetical protein